MQKIAGQEHYQINVEEILDDEKKANIKQEEDEKRLVELERHKVCTICLYGTSPICGKNSCLFMLIVT